MLLWLDPWGRPFNRAWIQEEASSCNVMEAGSMTKLFYAAWIHKDTMSWAWANEEEVSWSQVPQGNCGIWSISRRQLCHWAWIHDTTNYCNLYPQGSHIMEPGSKRKPCYEAWTHKEAVTWRLDPQCCHVMGPRSINKCDIDFGSTRKPVTKPGSTRNPCHGPWIH